ncbi:MFS transporter, partial [Streptomyces sp900116325]
AGPLRGGAFTALLTLMQATPDLGAALATPILRAGRLDLAAVAMLLTAGTPALVLLVPPRRPRSLASEPSGQ